MCSYTHLHLETSPAIKALTMTASLSVTCTWSSFMSESNIISDASSCLHFFPGLSRIGYPSVYRSPRYTGQEQDGHLQSLRNEHRIPDVAPRPMPEIMTQSSSRHAKHVFVRDLQFGLFLLEGTYESVGEVRDACMRDVHSSNQYSAGIMYTIDTGTKADTHQDSAQTSYGLQQARRTKTCPAAVYASTSGNAVLRSVGQRTRFTRSSSKK